MQAIAGTSKITPPRLQRIVERPRLLEMLEREKEKPLVLVLGQAAQGKSTLVASYSERCKRPSAWINLGREESDPVNLFRLVVQSVQHALKDGDLSGLLQYVAMDMGPRAETPLYQGWTQGPSHPPFRSSWTDWTALHPRRPPFIYWRCSFTRWVPESA